MNLTVNTCLKLLAGFYHCVYPMSFSYTRTVPNPPEMVNITPISGRELDVDWSPPANGIVDYYTLYLTSDHAHQINVTDKVFISYHRFTSLHPGETYTVHIRSHVANVMSSEVTMSAMTCKSSILGKQSLTFKIHINDNVGCFPYELYL